MVQVRDGATGVKSPPNSKRVDRGGEVGLLCAVKTPKSFGRKRSPNRKSYRWRTVYQRTICITGHFDRRFCRFACV